MSGSVAAKLRQVVTRRAQAMKWGVRLGRMETFRFPNALRVGGELRPIDVPTDNGTLGAFLELLLMDIYGLRTMTPSPKTVLDIGANVGLFCLAARDAFPNATIHAYEPNPALERFLQTQAAAADAPGVCRYFMEAVGREDGSVSLELMKDAVFTQTHSDPSGKIPAVAFRRCLERLGGSADLVKLDCEGAEWELWEDEQAWRQVQNLALEYHLRPGRTADDVARILNDLGFAVTRHVPHGETGILWAARPSKHRN